MAYITRKLQNSVGPWMSHGGKFGRGQMQKPFEEAAFALDVNELSLILGWGDQGHWALCWLGSAS